MAISLVAVGSALAAHPKAGKKYRGSTSASPINGFKPPVTFKVSKDGHKLTGFKWAGIGCFGAGGFGTGNPWTSKSLNHKVGSVKVSSNGSFAVTNSKASFTSHGYTTITTSTVKGKFTTSKHASGTITFSQKLIGHGSNQSCGPATVTFTASAK